MIFLIMFLIGAVIGALFENRRLVRLIRSIEKRDYLLRTYQNSKKSLTNSGHDLMPYFYHNGINSVITYGIGLYYPDFARSIDENRITVMKVDRDSDPNRGIYAPSEIGGLQGDVIIVTAVTYFDEILKQLKKQGEKRPILSLQELLFNAERE